MWKKKPNTYQLLHFKKWKNYETPDFCMLLSIEPLNFYFSTVSTTIELIKILNTQNMWNYCDVNFKYN